jgi:hypothetical protein
MGDEGKILDIQISDLKATAPHFHDQSTALVKAVRKLQTALSDAGAPWGDDDQGTQFHKVYGPHVKHIEDAATILACGLVSIHLAMVDMADGHIANDELIRSMFSKIKAPQHGNGHPEHGR